LTHIQSNACRFLFLLFTYLRFAEAASFDKKELCRSDTLIKDPYSIRINFSLVVALMLLNRVVYK
jgi:hypothetical protein